jgi:hypothetical protein
MLPCCKKKLQHAFFGMSWTQRTIQIPIAAEIDHNDTIILPYFVTRCYVFACSKVNPVQKVRGPTNTSDPPAPPPKLYLETAEPLMGSALLEGVLDQIF